MITARAGEQIQWQSKPVSKYKFHRRQSHLGQITKLSDAVMIHPIELTGHEHLPQVGQRFRYLSPMFGLAENRCHRRDCYRSNSDAHKHFDDCIGSAVFHVLRLMSLTSPTVPETSIRIAKGAAIRSLSETSRLNDLNEWTEVKIRRSDHLAASSGFWAIPMMRPPARRSISVLETAFIEQL